MSGDVGTRSEVRVWDVDLLQLIETFFRLYMWLDDKGKKSKISAPQYVDYVMTYVQKVVNDEATFPTKHGNEFPSNFDQVLKKIQKLLFHVVAHIYHSHFREVGGPLLKFWRQSKTKIFQLLLEKIFEFQIVLLGLHAHLNSIFAHIIEYNLFYHTIEDKETEVLQVNTKKLSTHTKENLSGLDPRFETRSRQVFLVNQQFGGKQREPWRELTALISQLLPECERRFWTRSRRSPHSKSKPWHGRKRDGSEWSKYWCCE